MPHYYQFYENYIQNKNRLNIKNACETLSIPQLIIHGNTDTSIAISEAENINKWNSKSQLKIIDGANHVFNTKHPWDYDKPSEALQTVIELILKFIK